VRDCRFEFGNGAGEYRGALQHAFGTPIHRLDNPFVFHRRPPPGRKVSHARLKRSLNPDYRSGSYRYSPISSLFSRIRLSRCRFN
jgi:hypothetical protein